jgi:hypothetical protein
MELEPEPEPKFFKSRNRNRNFSKVGIVTGTVKNSYGSTTLHITSVVEPRAEEPKFSSRSRNYILWLRAPFLSIFHRLEEILLKIKCFLKKFCKLSPGTILILFNPKDKKGNFQGI